MTPNSEKDISLRTTTILMDVRNTVVRPATKTSQALRLCDYYRLVNSDRATDRIQDAVRQLVEARKDKKRSNQIAPRRLSLVSAIEDSMRWCNKPELDGAGAIWAASEIDQRITQYISYHIALQVMAKAAYGADGASR